MAIFEADHIDTEAYISDVLASLPKATADYIPHCRLGYLSADGIKQMIKNGTLINGKPLVSHGKLKDIRCVSCLRAMQKRAAIPVREAHSPRHPNCEFGQHLHADCVVMKNCPTFDGGKYVLTMVDEKTFAPSVCIMKTEQHCLDQLKALVSRLKAKTGKNPLSITFDRGTPGLETLRFASGWSKILALSTEPVWLNAVGKMGSLNARKNSFGTSPDAS